MVGPHFKPCTRTSRPDEDRIAGIASVLEQLASVDRDLVQHSIVTGLLAARIARHMGLSAADIADSAAIGTLHEAGALHVPRLKESAAASWTEEEICRLHQLERSAAIRVVRADERIADLADAVGSFYDDVPPLVGRIVDVADTYDYFVREWSDRAALPPREAFRIIHERIGVRYDAAAVQALSELVGSIGYGLPYTLLTRLSPSAT